MIPSLYPREEARIAVIAPTRKWLDPFATLRTPWLPLRNNCVALSQQGVRYNLPFDRFKETRFDYHSTEFISNMRGTIYDGVIFYCETLYGDNAIEVASRVRNSRIKRLKNHLDPENPIPVIEYPVLYTWSYEHLAQAFLDVLTIGNLTLFQVPLEEE